MLELTLCGLALGPEALIYCISIREYTYKIYAIAMLPSTVKEAIFAIMPDSAARTACGFMFGKLWVCC